MFEKYFRQETLVAIFQWMMMSSFGSMKIELRNFKFETKCCAHARFTSWRRHRPLAWACWDKLAFNKELDIWKRLQAGNARCYFSMDDDVHFWLDED